MSILPFTLIFIIILTMFSSLALKKTLFYTVSNKLYHPDKQNEFVLTKKKEASTDNLKPLTGPPISDTLVRKKDTKKNRITSKRSYSYHKSYAKLDLHALLRANDPRQDVTRVFENLIRILYSQTDFYYEGMEYDIITHLSKKCCVTTLKTDKKYTPTGLLILQNIDSLSEIDFRDKSFQYCWYKMLKGSGNTGGYPSLLDFVTLTQKQYNGYRINMNSASQPLLEAIFNHPALAQAIIDKRQELKNEIFNKANELKKVQDKEFIDKFQQAIRYDLLPAYRYKYDDFQNIIAITNEDK